jgi:hypothetical protein
VEAPTLLSGESYRPEVCMCRCLSVTRLIMSTAMIIDGGRNEMDESVAVASAFGLAVEVEVEVEVEVGKESRYYDTTP